MITDDVGLRLALDQLSQVYTALAALRTEHPTASREWLAVLAEGFRDHAHQLQQEVEAYAGVSAITDAGPDQVEMHTGQLREIDLDNRTMTLRNAGGIPEVSCTFDESLLEAAKEALDRRVRVWGMPQNRPGRGTLPTLHVSSLEVLDETARNGEPAPAGNSKAAG